MWIAWNADRSEGAIFDNKADAMHAAGQMHNNPTSSLADAFRDLYVESNFDEDEECSIEQVELPDAD